MIAGLSTRALAPSDRQQIITELAAWTPGVDFGLLLPAALFHPNPGLSLLVLDEDGALAGFIIAMKSKSRPGCGYVHLVWVSPALRGHGLASQLYDRIFSALRAQGCDRVEAATAAVNTHAVDFHRKLGFTIGPPEVIADHFGSQREGVVMWRHL
jgi:ribosomal protein S18 acetylase RimI-like enzyme